jgi:hypothetical protein
MNNNGVSTMKSGNAVGREISGSTLKLIAIITMLIDHTAAVVLEKIIVAGESSNTIAYDSVLYFIYVLMRMIGRLAFPIFCFLLVEGFLHTRSVRKYAIRLAAFALISEIPFDLALFGEPFYFNYQNVFFTLLIGLLVMIGFKFISEKAADKKWLTILAIVGAITLGGISSFAIINFINNLFGILNENANGPIIILGADRGLSVFGFSFIVFLIYLIIVKKRSLREANVKFANLAVLTLGMLLADFLTTDYSGFGVLTIAVMYGLRRNHFKAILGGCATLVFMSFSEATCFIDLILIRFYNGKRGLSLKYVFYVFYPVHLFLLYLVCYFMKLV